MIRRPPRSTLSSSSTASDVYKRQIYSIAAEVFCKLQISDPVSDYIRVLKIDSLCQIFQQHCCARLPCRSIIFRKCSVDENFRETDSLAFKNAKHLIVRGPEGLFRK